MKLKISALLLGLMLFAFGASWTFAQDSSDTKSKSDTRTITGCLSKGDNSDSSNEFLLTANDGSTWEVRSDAVSLADHVGHLVWPEASSKTRPRITSRKTRRMLPPMLI